MPSLCLKSPARALSQGSGWAGQLEAETHACTPLTSVNVNVNATLPGEGEGKEHFFLYPLQL